MKSSGELMTLGPSDLKFDCKYFKGDVPCLPSKLRGKVCPSCDEYTKTGPKILFIKLGAIGDVLRSTALVRGLKRDFPGAQITWITRSPEILSGVELEVCAFDFTSLYQIANTEYDIAINLDKDKEACILLKNVSASKKYGFTWENNHVAPATAEAEHKIMTGLFDHLSKTNTKHYLEEIFEICGMTFRGERYLLNTDQQLREKFAGITEAAEGKTIIGLNTGCGRRWQTRLWPAEHWVNLIRLLQREHYFPLILGGPDEDEQNRQYSEDTGAVYPGNFALPEFVALTSHCDMVVTAVSMMMHIAIGLNLPLVLFNNIFNRHEFYLYDNGIIVEPPTGCDCYFGNICTRKKHCMPDISVEQVYAAIDELRCQQLKRPLRVS
jgi:ADP-heptose:LPS heptosyltransferase